jgi:hypothetical protein
MLPIDCKRERVILTQSHPLFRTRPCNLVGFEQFIAPYEYKGLKLNDYISGHHHNLIPGAM